MSERFNEASLVNQLERDRGLLLLQQPFTAALSLRLQLNAVKGNDIPTAATDGRSVFFNVDFANRIDDKTRQFVLCHEVWHCVMGHFSRQQSREHQRWNRAVDYEVNSIVKQLLGFVPPQALYRYEYKELSAEQIYPQLMVDEEKPEQGVLDTHLPINSEQQQRWREYVQQAKLANAAHWSSLPGNVKKQLEQVVSPSLPWQHLLQRFVQRQLIGERQWLPPSRRHIHRGLYLPRQRSDFIELTVALDTSGSCSDELAVFLQQLSHLLAAFQDYRVTVLQCDRRIQHIDTFTPDSPLNADSFTAKGFGGTAFKPVLDYVDKHPTNALIYFTDGCAEIPTKPPQTPLLWVLPETAGNDRIPWGEVATIST